MMFKAEVRDLIAECYEEVIGAVVAALVESAGLAYEAVEVGDVFFGEIDLFGAVGGHIEVVLGRNLGSERDFAEVAACEKRTADKLLAAYCFEGAGLPAA